MEFDLENPMTNLKEHQPDTVSALFDAELDHMPAISFKTDEFLVAVRREAVSFISQAQFYYKFDDFTAYLAVNYVDRFISKREFPQEKPWIVKLIAVSCLSLAAKMKNTHLPLSDLQRGEAPVFDSKSIHRMEILILATLDWRMRSITPFSFLCFFISLLETNNSSLNIIALKERASDFIFRSHYEIKLLDYKPSIIAASALLCSSRELFPHQFSRFRAAILSCGYMHEDMVVAGYEVMLDASSYGTSSKVNGVDRCGTNIDSTSEKRGKDGVMSEKNDIKRRKLTDLCNGNALQISHIQHC